MEWWGRDYDYEGENEGDDEDPPSLRFGAASLAPPEMRRGKEGGGIHSGGLSRQPVNLSVNTGDFVDCSRQASRQKSRWDPSTDAT
jgi:hypothetical protein